MEGEYKHRHSKFTQLFPLVRDLSGEACFAAWDLLSQYSVLNDSSALPSKLFDEKVDVNPIPRLI